MSRIGHKVILAVGLVGTERTTLGSCFILNDIDQLGKFDKKTDEGMFIGYSLTSKVFRVFNIRTRTIQESINVTFDEKETRSSDFQKSQSKNKEASDFSKLREDNQRAQLEEPHTSGTTFSGPSDNTPSTSDTVGPSDATTQNVEEERQVSYEEEGELETHVEETSELLSPSLENYKEHVHSTTEIPHRLTLTSLKLKHLHMFMLLSHNGQMIILMIKSYVLPLMV
ncbi:hypothetical protein L6452_18291 [Arctium lappa]|uniref:Uncharacterized protein n=1 Tax=Arctium lappa TaxID=4217 RepID=A0ACB9C5Y6_ARCLA|nr:hypothetical protein L6452_18291 [Arctium lappa]